MRQFKEQAIAGVTRGEMRLGETVTWRARHFGVRFRMTSKISLYDRPFQFVDEQISGPFKRWWHHHEFRADGDATLMTDRVDFQAPFGALGRLVEWLVLRRYMRNLILQRNEWLRRELES